MADKKTTVPFDGTPGQAEELRAVIARIKDEKGSLMPIMQKAQEIYGYLPIQVQTMISDQTGHRTSSGRNLWYSNILFHVQSES